jgi:heat shock protein HtpX
MKRKILESHTGLSILQSALVIAIIGGMSALMAWSLFGNRALIWGALIAVAAMALTPRISPQALFSMYGGRLLHPFLAPGLQELAAELSARARLSAVPRLYLIPSPQANAMSVGSRTESAVGVTQGLLDSLTMRELAGVMAHEIGHIAAGDLLVMGLARTAGQITSALAFVGRILVLVNLPFLFMGGVAVPWLFVILLVGAPLVSTGLQTALSRSREYAADEAAVDLTSDAEGFASALRKIDERSNLVSRLFGLPGAPRGSSLFSTHPPNEERIKRLLAQTRRGGGMDERAPHGGAQLPV